MTRTDLPSGTVTFLFTDIEGSTRLLQELGAAGYAEALGTHRRLLREAFSAGKGVEVDTQGDAFFYVFQSASDATAAAIDAQSKLAGGPIRVRMGLHTGSPELTDEGYVGHDVHKAARIAAAAYGGQVLLSGETMALVDLEVLDLGEHRLRDMDERAWLYQLGMEPFPPLRTVSNTNLPRPASSFIGRDRERNEVRGLLEGSARLLTLTGPGGSGKTRLAVEAASELVPAFRNGVFWVGLASLRDPDLVMETIAQAEGAKGDLASYLKDREMLLLIDNFEQVVEAAPDLPPLLEGCPSLRLLVTSRERLRVRGEVEYAVAPLAQAEGVDLFCARAGVEPGATVTELCRRLDNLPLALELAAARVGVLSPRQILERIGSRLDLLAGGRDADPRQRTLRAAIEWSHELLSTAEGNLFARLAVFRGGWTLDAAEQVCGAELDVLDGLVGRSLVQHADERFTYLETIREFAAERLSDSGEADGLQMRHASWYLALAEAAGPHLRRQSVEWSDRIELEHDNLRAAYDRLGSLGETQAVLQLVGALWEFWRDRGHTAEGRRRVEQALSADDRPTAARARALNAASFLAASSGEPTAGRERAEEALAINRGLGDPAGTADSLGWLGWALVNEGDPGEGLAAAEQSLALAEQLGDEYQTMFAQMVVAHAHDALGNREPARHQAEALRRRAQETAFLGMEAVALDLLAKHAIEANQADEAVSLSIQTLRIYHLQGDLMGVSSALPRCARALAVGGEVALAVQLIACWDVLAPEMGGMMPDSATMKEETLRLARDLLADADFDAAWDAGRRLTFDQAVQAALAAERFSPR